MKPNDEVPVPQMATWDYLQKPVNLHWVHIKVPNLLGGINMFMPSTKEEKGSGHGNRWISM